MLEQGGYGKSASQIRNFGIRIGSEGWAGRAGVRSGAGPAPRLEERPSRRPGFRLVVAAGKRARRALVVAVPSRGRWRRGVPSRAAHGVRGSGGARGARGVATALLRSPPPPPPCKAHGEPCVLRTVKKAGPTMGRQFFVCARPQGE